MGSYDRYDVTGAGTGAGGTAAVHLPSSPRMVGIGWVQVSAPSLGVGRHMLRGELVNPSCPGDPPTEITFAVTVRESRAQRASQEEDIAAGLLPAYMQDAQSQT